MASKLLNPVGVVVVIEGLAAFNRNAYIVERQLQNINRATGNLGTKSIGSWIQFITACNTAAITIAGFGVAAVGAASAAAGAIVKVGASFQDELQYMQAATLATDAQMEQLGNKIQQVASDSRVGIQDLATATTELIKAGASIQDALGGGIEAINNLVIASRGEVDVAESSRILVGAMESFNMAASDIPRIVDMMAGISNVTTTTIGQLTRGFSQAIPIFSELGFTMDDLVISQGLLAQRFIRGEQAGTTLKVMFQRLEAPSKRALELMQQYGISLYDANGEVIAEREIIGRLADAFSNESIALNGVTEAQRNYALATMFGTRAVNAAIVLANEGREGYDKMQLAASKTTAAEMAERAQQENLNASLQKLSNNLTIAGQKVAQTFLPYITKAVDGVKDFVKALDVKTLQLFGNAMGVAFSGTGFDEFVKDANDLLDLPWSTTLIGLVKSLQTARNELVDLGKLVGFVAKSFYDISDSTAQSTETFNAISYAIQRVNDGFQTAGIAIATANELLIKARGNTDDLQIAILAITAAPFVMIGIALAPMLGQLLAIAAGITAVVIAIRELPDAWDAATRAWTIGQKRLEERGGPRPINLDTILAAFGNADAQARAAQADIERANKAVQQSANDINSSAQNMQKNTGNSLSFIGDAVTFLGQLFGGLAQAGGDAASHIQTAADTIIGAYRRAAAEWAQFSAQQAAANRPMTHTAAPSYTGVLQGAAHTVVNPFPSGVGGISYPGGGGGGGGDTKESLDEIKKRVAELLKDFPLLNQELIDFFANIAQDAPGRLQPMVDSLQKSKSLLGDMLVAQVNLLNTKYKIYQIDQNLERLNARLATLEAQKNLVTVEYEERKLNLKMQQFAIDKAMWPLQDRMTKLDRQIADINRTNYELLRKNLDLQIQSIPIQNKIADIEQQITDVINKRLALQQRAQEINAELKANSLSRQAKKVEKSLEEAWESMDVGKILELEEIQYALKKQQKAAEDNLDAIRDTQTETQLKDELTQTGLELEKLQYEELLKPINAQVEALRRITEMQDLQNQKAVSYLQEQRDAIEKQLQVLEDQKLAIDRISQAIEIEMAQRQLQFDKEMVQVQAQIAKEQERRAQLEETRIKQEATFNELILAYVNTLVQSGAFTVGEAAEVAKRMGMWTDSVAKILEMATAFGTAQIAANKLNVEIASIPKDIYVTVHIKKQEEGGGTQSAQWGGYVEGPLGSPQLILAHGGERFLGVGVNTPSIEERLGKVQYIAPVQASRAQNISNSSTIINHNYNVNANYLENRSPVTIENDLRALILLTRR